MEAEPQSPSLPIDNLSLNGTFQQLIKELKAQCPPGKETEFENLISKIVLIPQKEEVEVSEESSGSEEIGKELKENTEESKDDEINDSESIEAETTLDPVQEELNDYVKEFFPSGAKLSYTNSSEVKLSAIKLNPSNFWGVSWQSQWQKQQEQQKEEEQEKQEKWCGSVKVISHFYEDGNVQLHATRQFTGTGSLKAFIQRSEDSLQMSLNEAYQQLADVSFKRLRRQLPITRQKMDWNKYVTYKLSTELKN